MTFPQKLYKLMEEKGLNKNQLSINTGIPYSSIADILKERYAGVKLETAKRLADYFGVTLDYLLRDEITTREKEKPTADEGDDLARLLAGADATDLKILRAMATLDAAGKKELMDYALYLSRRGK